MDPASREPLYPLILEAINAKNGNGEGREKVDPSFYLIGETTNGGGDRSGIDNDSNYCRRMSQFWMEAHKLSCLKHGAFHSSIERTYDDTAISLSSEPPALSPASRNHNVPGDSNREMHFDLLRAVIGGTNCCARIRAMDGKMLSTDLVSRDGGGGADENVAKYHVAFCIRGANKDSNARNAPVGSLASASGEQLKTVSRLSGQVLRASSQHCQNPEEQYASLKTKSDTTKSTSWFRYPTFIAQRVTSGVSYAIDRVLTAYEGEDDYDPPIVEQEEWDDAKSIALCQIDNDNGDDDAMTVKKGVHIRTIGVDESIRNSDEIINLEIVADVCRLLLSFSKLLQTQQLEEGASNNMYIPGHHHPGNVERVILYKNGWDLCSFGWLCRQAGRSYVETAGQNTTVSSSTITIDGLEKPFGQILLELSDRGVNVLLSTLCQSNFALVENDIITLFPGGIPFDSLKSYRLNQSDHALFQIHTTKLTIQSRMTRLEQTANIAKENAVRAKRNNTTQLALVHLRRRKAALAELERCASIVTNLDASELRLERAENDVAIAQSYALLKTALRDIRTPSGDAVSGDGSSSFIESVEELMIDVREEMEHVSTISDVIAGGSKGVQGVSSQCVASNEDELNEEFKLLEMECQRDEESSSTLSGTVYNGVRDKKNGQSAGEQEGSTLQSLGGQQTLEGSDVSKAKLVTA